MSFNIYIKNNKSISYNELLENKYLPKSTNISFGVAPTEILDGYSKLYTPKLSSRGVAITTNQDNYNVEVNVGATKDDWRLAVKISLALGDLNNSLISPEFDNELSISEFEEKYNEDWIEDIKYLGIDTFMYMIKEGTDVVLTLMGCIRHFYVGEYVINKLSADNPSSELFNDRLIEELRKIQYLEDYENEIEFPSVRIMDFPEEGEKKLTIFPADFKVLLPKADYVILNKIGEAMAKVPYKVFINHINSKAKRIDELQYVINPVNEIEHFKMILHFKELESSDQNIIHSEKEEKLEKEKQTEKIEPKKWWKFWE